MLSERPRSSLLRDLSTYGTWYSCSNLKARRHIPSWNLLVSRETGSETFYERGKTGLRERESTNDIGTLPGCWFGKQGPSIFLIHKTTKLQHEPLSPSRLATLLQLSTKRNNIKIHPCSILIARNHLSPHIISFGARTAIEIKIEAAARSILPCSPMPFTNDHYSRGDSFMFKPIKVSSSEIVSTQEIRYRFLRPP